MIKPRIVIKLSGSLFNFDTNPSQLNDYIQLIKKINNVYQPVIITGGGKIARFYINLSRSLGMDESGLDLIGIQVSHLNARLLISGLAEYCYPLPPRNLEEISVSSLIRLSYSNRWDLSWSEHQRNFCSDSRTNRCNKVLQCYRC